MATRDQRARIAAETVAIATGGSYRAPSGREVSIADAVQRAVEGGTLITPNTANSLQSRIAQLIAERSFKTEFAVNNQTTLAAARGLVQSHRPTALPPSTSPQPRTPAAASWAGLKLRKKASPAQVPCTCA